MRRRHKAVLPEPGLKRRFFTKRKSGRSGKMDPEPLLVSYNEEADSPP
jgi:hypothetical protein